MLWSLLIPLRVAEEFVLEVDRVESFFRHVPREPSVLVVFRRRGDLVRGSHRQVALARVFGHIR